MKFIAFDPGTSCGFAVFEDGIYTTFGVVRYPTELVQFLVGLPKDIELVVCEDYKVRDERHGGFDHLWNNVTPAKVIGMIEFYAAVRGIPVILQQPAILQAASKMMFGKPYVKSSSQKQHSLDAILHGGYALKTGRIEQFIQSK